MANRKREKPLTDEERKARNRRYRHTANHKKSNISARAHNRAARLAAQWVQEEHPAVWARLKAEAWKIEEKNGKEYVPHAVRFAAESCPHDKVVAIGITVQCANCKMIIGSVAVEDEANKEILQDILEDEL